MLEYSHSHSEPETLNGIESVEEQLNSKVDDIFFAEYFWEQSDILCKFNLYLTVATMYGGGLGNENPVLV
jgi:hypothetical protein